MAIFVCNSQEMLSASSQSQLPYRLRLPGPTPVPQRVREAISHPIVNHRGPEFHSLYDRVQELIKPVLGTQNPVYLFPSSGTGVMEASLVNILAPGERLLVVVNGQFGERFASIGKLLGAQVDLLEVPWGQALDAPDIEKRVKTTDYRAVVVVHNESSTGIVNNLAAIGEILRNRPTLLIVDSVSGLAGLEMQQDAWAVDIVVSASQKCLMCPPGIGLVSMSSKAWEIVKRDDRMPRFYWDFRRAKTAAEKSETSFTGPVSLLAGLQQSLEMIHEEGLHQVLARHKRLSTMLRAGCAELGLLPFGQESAYSNTVVVLKVPEQLDGAVIVRRLYEGFRTVIAGARNKLAGKVIRIGTMGHVQETDIAKDLAQLEEVLRSI